MEKRILEYLANLEREKDIATWNLINHEYYTDTIIEDDIGQNDNVYYKI